METSQVIFIVILIFLGLYFKKQSSHSCKIVKGLRWKGIPLELIQNALNFLQFTCCALLVRVFFEAFGLFN